MLYILSTLHGQNIPFYICRLSVLLKKAEVLLVFPFILEKKRGRVCYWKIWLREENAIKSLNPKSWTGTDYPRTRALPCFGDLVLGGKEGIVDSGRGGVSKGSEAQQFDLGEPQGAGIPRAMETKADSWGNFSFYQLDFYIGETTRDNRSWQR